MAGAGEWDDVRSVTGVGLYEKESDEEWKLLWSNKRWTKTELLWYISEHCRRHLLLVMAYGLGMEHVHGALIR